MAENGLMVCTVHYNNIVHFKTIDEIGGLGGQDNLAPVGSLSDQFGQLVDGSRMQAQFGFVDNYHFGHLGLQQQGCKGYETKGSIRKAIAVEIHVGILLFPFQTDSLFVVGIRTELEALEIGGDGTYHAFYQAERLFVVQHQRIQVSGQVGAVVAQVFVVVDRAIAAHGRTGAGVVEMIDGKAAQIFLQIGGPPFFIVLQGKFFHGRVPDGLVPLGIVLILFMKVVEIVARMLDISFVGWERSDFKEKGIGVIKVYQPLNGRRYFSALTQQVVDAALGQGIASQTLFVYRLGQFKE